MFVEVKCLKILNTAIYTHVTIPNTMLYLPHALGRVHINCNGYSGVQHLDYKQYINLLIILIELLLEYKS